MVRTRSLVAVLALVAGVAFAETAPRAAREGKEEIRWLDRMLDPANWSPSECTVEKSDLKCPVGEKAVHMHVPVDYNSGEPKYLIGWPRMACAMKEPEGDWSQWDRFEFTVLAKFSRPQLPKTAVTVLLGTRPAEFSRNLELAELDKWVKITVPVAAAKEKGVPIQAIPQVRFSVSEKDYQDKDAVDFHIGGFRLVRSAECEVAEMSVATPAVFSGQPSVKLNLTVAGPPEDVKRGVPFVIRRKDDVVRREMLPLARGKQVYDCDVSELKLAPGDYELIVFEDDAAKRKAASFKVVEQPWKQE